MNLQIVKGEKNKKWKEIYDKVVFFKMKSTCIKKNACFTRTGTNQKIHTKCKSEWLLKGWEKKRLGCRKGDKVNK